jgi:hypothetical protein
MGPHARRFPAAYKCRRPCCARPRLQNPRPELQSVAARNLAGRRFGSAPSPLSRRREALRELRMKVRSTLVHPARDSAFRYAFPSSPEPRLAPPAAPVALSAAAIYAGAAAAA